ncbi:MAG: hypothetical protein JSR21_16260 [Proteobacteria bacterium]|nr:hypothetical protein [Pseudomonadota bacterium]
MRRFALLGVVLSVAGCSGFGQFISDTHTFQSNPNMPPGDSENMQRARGMDANVQALTPEPGNIWPPPAGPMPTLMDLEKQSNLNNQNIQNPAEVPKLPVGSSTPPGVQGYGGALPAVPKSGIGAEAPAPMPSATTMPTIQQNKPLTYPTTPLPSVTTGGGPGYSTITSPQGQSIVVPNGNGTSTIIHPDGTVETVPTPKP